MTIFRLFISVALAVACAQVHAQVYSGGKNLNDQNTYFITIELEKKANDPFKYIAEIDFYGKSADSDLFIEDNQGHKTFESEHDLIKFLEENGWFYLYETQIKPRSSSTVQRKYSFRKSMQILDDESMLQKQQQNYKVIAKDTTR